MHFSNLFPESPPEEYHSPVGFVYYRERKVCLVFQRGFDVLRKIKVKEQGNEESTYILKKFYSYIRKYTYSNEYKKRKGKQDILSNSVSIPNKETNLDSC